MTDAPPSNPVLSRRTVLAGGLTGAIASVANATTVAAFSPVRSPVPENAPRVIRVPAGREVRIELGDGDSLSDLVIDVSALDASYHITASGSGWEVRNLAIVGRHPGADAAAFSASVPDRDGVGVIDNVWLGDGSRDSIGIFVPPAHAGTLLIRRCYVANYPNNGIYGSPPGNGPGKDVPGAGGRVRIERSYAYNNAIAGFRIGTAGSWVKESVVLQDRRTPSSIGGDATRAIWVYYESASIENVDFRMADGTGIVAGNGYWEKSVSRVTLRNVRGEAEDLVAGERADIQGAVAPNPVIEAPHGCPRSPSDVFAAPVAPLAAVGSEAPEIETPENPAWIPAIYDALGAFSVSVFGPVLGVIVVVSLLLSPGLAILALVLYVLYRRGDWEPGEW